MRHVFFHRKAAVENDIQSVHSP